MPENTPPAPVAKDYSALYVPGAIVIAGVIIGLSVIFAFSGTRAPAVGGQPTVDVNVEDVVTDGRPFIGREDAPVTLAAWADYQCPFCKAVEVGHPQIPTPPSMPILIRDYVDTGKLKIVFKDYAFLSEDSNTAALYGHAVWEHNPAKYYEWREAMYDAQDEEHGGFGDEASILQLIRTIAGLDADAIKALVAKNTAKYTEMMEADRAEGASFGITGTPGFITGETLIPGAVGIDEFKKAIDAQL